MVSQYDAVARRALAMIRRKGAPVSFGTSGTLAFDPTRDTYTGAAGAVVGSAVRVGNDLAQLSQLGVVAAAAITLLVAAQSLSVTPTPGMPVTFAGVVYTIKNVDPIAPDGTAIVYAIVGSR